MEKFLSIVIFASLITFVSTYGQKVSVTSQVKRVDGYSLNFNNYINSLPAFTMFGDNYFVTGTSIENDAFTSNTSDVKFEIGFKQRLTNVNLPLGVFPFVTYRQKAFWDVYKESLPFRELNFNPAIGITKLFFIEHNYFYGLHLAFEHESNGRDGHNSRSWNFFSLTYFKPVGKNLQLKAKAWIPIGDLEGNEDVVSYRGLFNLGVSYKARKDLYFDLDLQPAYDKRLQGHVKASISLKLAKASNQFVYLQYFGGYAEDLINYNQSVNYVRVGFVFKDLVLNFRE